MCKSVRRISTPMGNMRLAADAEAITGLHLWRPGDEETGAGQDCFLDEAERQIDAYMQGKLTVFELPLAPEGTAFEKRVWSELLKIPYGETVSYAALASCMGKERAFRAVGRACGRNPLLIIVPCHRVIASSGALAGYAGGLGMKQKLLTLEGHMYLTNG